MQEDCRRFPRSRQRRRLAGQSTLLLIAILTAVPTTLLARGAEVTGPLAPTTIPLWPEGTPGIDAAAKPEELGGGRLRNIRNPAMIFNAAPAAKTTGAAVVICPGGGYRIVAADHEGTQIAEWLNSLGVSAFVLHYRLPSTPGVDYRHPAPLQDAQRAVAIVRSRAKEWGIDPGKVGVMGFSAGGHLASIVATHFDEPVIGPTESLGVSVRPDFVILVYPVMSLIDDRIVHGGSREHLLGPKDGCEMRRRLSAEVQVTPRTPPVFLAHAKDDKVVLPENSMRLHAALEALGILSALHLYEDGGHGGGLGRPNSDLARWPGDCAEWLRVQGVAKPAEQSPAGFEGDPGS